MIYLLPLLFLSVFVLLNEYLRSPKRCENTIIYLLFIGYYTILMALRYRVGIDTLNYMESYELLSKVDNISLRGILSTFEPLYFALCLLCRAISEDFVVLQIAHTLIINILISIFIFRNTQYRLTALLFYLIVCFLYFNTEIIRESIAVAIFINAVELLKRRRYGWYYIVMVAASGFHTSALVTLLIPLFMNLRLNRLFFGSLALFATLLYLYTEELLPIFVMAGGGNLIAMEKIITYMNTEPLNVNWLIVTMFRSIALPALFLTLYNHNEDPQDQFEYTNMILLYIIVSFGILFIQIIFARIGNYFIFFYILLLTELLHKLKMGRLRYLNFALISLLLLSYGQYYFRSTENVVAGSFEYSRWYPYSSVLDKRVEPQREQIWNR